MIAEAVCHVHNAGDVGWLLLAFGGVLIMGISLGRS